MARRIEVTEADFGRSVEVITKGALSFIADLHSEFSQRRQELLARRGARQKEFDGGTLPDFLPETEQIRSSDWKINPIPRSLDIPRIEITGPASSRKMVINALNSGANLYMADSEDSESPTWENIVNGQINLYDAARQTIAYSDPSGKVYELNEKTAVLLYRPRGWHLLEKHLLVDGEPVSASLFDFGMYFYHNAWALFQGGAGPYFYLPKLESHLEARLWNDVFCWAEKQLRFPPATIKATVLIETLTAAFAMDEILYELREHSAGLNCGRWDYIFSFIKTLRLHSEVILPDRAAVTMDKGFLSAYVNLLVKTCRRRGAQPIGGMSAYIPIKNDPEANERVLAKVRADKALERKKKLVGAWVAHPGLVSLVKEIFEMPVPETDLVNMDEVTVSAKDLLEIPAGEITEAGLRTNIRVAIQYLEAWLKGTGCVPLNNLMEDAATAEICRSQIWQWVKHRAKLADGREITRNLVWDTLVEELEKMGHTPISFSWHKHLASHLFFSAAVYEPFTEFITLQAYEALLNLERENKREVKMYQNFDALQ